HGLETRVLRPTTIYCALAAVTITNQKKSDEFPVPAGLTAAWPASAPAGAVAAERAPPYRGRTRAARSGPRRRPCRPLPRSATARRPAIRLAGRTERRDRIRPPA